MLRKLLIAAIGSSLLVSVWAAPASAVSPPQVLEVNAIPGTPIEICSGGVEHLTLKYGKAADWTPDAGVQQVWAIRKAANGKCKGKWLATFRHTFEEGKSYTVAYWKPKTGVTKKVFENDIGVTLGQSTMTFRHVAMVGSADVWVWQKIPRVAIVDEGPTVNALRRGKSSPVITTPPRDTMVAVFPEKANKRWKSAFGSKRLKPDTAYQVLLMGNSQKSMKLKFYALP